MQVPYLLLRPAQCNRFIAHRFFFIIPLWPYYVRALFVDFLSLMKERIFFPKMFHSSLYFPLLPEHILQNRIKRSLFETSILFSVAVITYAVKYNLLIQYRSLIPSRYSVVTRNQYRIMERISPSIWYHGTRCTSIETGASDITLPPISAGGLLHIPLLRRIHVKVSDISRPWRQTWVFRNALPPLRNASVLEAFSTAAPITSAQFIGLKYIVFLIFNKRLSFASQILLL